MQLFNEKSDWTPQALQIDKEARKLLQPIIDKCLKENGNLQELHYCLCSTLFDLIVDARLERGLD